MILLVFPSSPLGGHVTNIQTKASCLDTGNKHIQLSEIGLTSVNSEACKIFISMLSIDVSSIQNPLDSGE